MRNIMNKTVAGHVMSTC